MSYQNAAEELKNLGNKFKAIASVGDFLEKVGSLDQAAKDAVVRKDAAYKAESDAKAKQVEAEKALELANKKVAECKAGAELIVENATKRAYDILEEAKKKADVFVLGSKTKDEEIKASIVASKKIVAELAESIVSKKDELQAIQKQIDDLKNKMAAFVK